MEAAAPARITAESKINEVLARHPGTAPVFTQGRRLYVDQPRELYARFPGLSVGDFARQNGMDLGRLLGQLNVTILHSVKDVPGFLEIPCAVRIKSQFDIRSDGFPHAMDQLDMILRLISAERQLDRRKSLFGPHLRMVRPRFERYFIAATHVGKPLPSVRCHWHPIGRHRTTLKQLRPQLMQRPAQYLPDEIPPRHVQRLFPLSIQKIVIAIISQSIDRTQRFLRKVHRPFAGSDQSLVGHQLHKPPRTCWQCLPPRRIHPHHRNQDLVRPRFNQSQPMRRKPVPQLGTKASDPTLQHCIEIANIVKVHHEIAHNKGSGYL